MLQKILDIELFFHDIWEEFKNKLILRLMRNTHLYASVLNEVAKRDRNGSCHHLIHQWEKRNFKDFSKEETDEIYRKWEAMNAKE